MNINGQEEYAINNPHCEILEVLIDGKVVCLGRDIRVKKVKYANPYIPEGYKYVSGEWNNGFVIERESDKSQFVWIPVGYLDGNGTLDGENFTEKLGRRNYKCVKFSKGNLEKGFYENLTEEVKVILQSIKQYGGFYISRYHISMNSEGRLQSIKGARPLEVYCNTAKEMAESMEKLKGVTSHLTYGFEYDSVMEWLIKSNERTVEEVVEDSTNWGNYSNTSGSKKEILETGSLEEWKSNNLYDLAGNVDEFTQEKYWDEEEKTQWNVLRGGCFQDNGDQNSAFCRKISAENETKHKASFRVVLCIKEERD